MVNEVYVGSWGVTFTVSTNVDLTAAATYYLEIKKPETDTEVIWYPTISASSSLVYVSGTADLDEVGVYSLQSYAEWGDPVDSKHWGKTAYFEVFERYTP